MLERIIAQIALALFGWLETRAQRGSTAVDSVSDRDRLRRAGVRLREWMRKQDGAGSGDKPGPNRT